MILQQGFCSTHLTNCKMSHDLTEESEQEKKRDEWEESRRKEGTLTG